MGGLRKGKKRGEGDRAPHRPSRERSLRPHQVGKRGGSPAAPAGQAGGRAAPRTAAALSRGGGARQPLGQGEAWGGKGEDPS